jgi:hypothetical protein
MNNINKEYNQTGLSEICIQIKLTFFQHEFMALSGVHPYCLKPKIMSK